MGGVRGGVRRSCLQTGSATQDFGVMVENGWSRPSLIILHSSVDGEPRVAHIHHLTWRVRGRG